MKIDMIMPQMGESIVEGTIIKWHKRIGETVHKDEMILEISTDKVDSEIPSPVDGVLAEILADEGKTVSVGSAIARIEAQSANVVAAGSEHQAPEAADAPAAVEKPHLSAKPEMDLEEEGERRFLSPVVKKIAREHGMTADALARVTGSGANGRITKADILAFLQRQPAVSLSIPAVTTVAASASAKPVEAPQRISRADQEIVPMDHVRKRIAEHMVMSKHTAPHVTSVAEVDLTPIVQYRESVKKSFEQREGFPLTYTAFFVDAAARAIKEFPLINSSVDGDRIIMKKNINIGVAVGMESGLIVPVVRQADQLNLVGIARTVNDLAVRARSKQLKPEEVQGGTFSITNIGTFGNLFGTPIINQPQVAILGAGAIKKRVVVINDAIAIRSMMYISLTYDHRIIDGLYGGSFLQKIVQLLENFSI